jgi:hypothetical protein
MPCGGANAQGTTRPMQAADKGSIAPSSRLRVTQAAFLLAMGSMQMWVFQVSIENLRSYAAGAESHWYF